MRLLLLITITLVSLGANAGVSFKEPSSSSNIKTAFYQNTVMEEKRLRRVVELLEQAGKYKAVHLEYVDSAISELKKAIKNNSAALRVSPYRMIRFRDMDSDLNLRLNLLSKYYDLIKFKLPLRSSSKYIHGGELNGTKAKSMELADFSITVAMINEVIENLVIVNQATQQRDMGRIKGLKYLDYNKRFL